MARGKSEEYRRTGRKTAGQDAAAIKEFMSTRDLRPLALPRDTTGGYNNAIHGRFAASSMLEHVYDATYVCNGRARRTGRGEGEEKVGERRGEIGNFEKKIEEATGGAGEGEKMRS